MTAHRDPRRDARRRPPSWQGTHIVVPHVHACWMCRKPTRFLHVDFQAALHPGPCTVTAWLEYDKANQRVVEEMLWQRPWWKRARDSYLRRRRGESKLLF